MYTVRIAIYRYNRYMDDFSSFLLCMCARVLLLGLITTHGVYSSYVGIVLLYFHVQEFSPIYYRNFPIVSIYSSVVVAFLFRVCFGYFINKSEFVHCVFLLGSSKESNKKTKLKKYFARVI